VPGVDGGAAWYGRGFLGEEAGDQAPVGWRLVLLCIDCVGLDELRPHAVSFARVNSHEDAARPTGCRSPSPLQAFSFHEVPILHDKCYM